jgi:hypothetical protein
MTRTIWFASILCLAAGSMAADDSKTIQVNHDAFKCLTSMTPVRGFFVGNLLGKEDATVKVARSAQGGVYPPRNEGKSLEQIELERSA